jgi:hypothetical protein
MDIRQPQMRRRGFFLPSSDGEPDTGEYENPEGFTVRVRFPSHRASRKVTSGRSHRTDARVADDRPSIRSGSVTGSRQRAHLPR